MADDSFTYVNPYGDYQIEQLPVADGVRGNALLDRVQSLQVGFGSQVLRIDRDGLWMGAEDFASAPFSVDMEGVMIATSLDLSNYLEVGQSLTDLQGIITNISDIDSSLGTITAGNLIGVTVTGGTVRTASSGTRVEMTGANNRLDVYSGSTRRMSLDADSLEFYDTGGTKTADITVDSGYNFNINSTGSGYAGWQFNSSYGIYFTGTSVVCIIANGGVAMQNNAVLSTYSIVPQSGAPAIGESGSPYGNVYVTDLFVADDIELADNLIMQSGGYIQGFTRLLWSGTTANPTGDGTMVYYDSGTEGLRMQFGGSDFQFDATGV